MAKHNFTKEELDKVSEIIGLPGPPIPQDLLEAYLEPDEDEESYTLEEAIKLAKEELRKNRLK